MHDADLVNQARGKGWLGIPAGVWALAAGLFAVRLVFLVGFSPYELVGDEAHYWEWSRRLMLSYYTKGPGVAWVIAASTAVFGDSAWAVRLPSVLLASVMTLTAGWLGGAVSGGDRRAAWFAALAVTIVPGYLATSLLMTIDQPYTTCWLLAVALAYRYGQRPGYGWAAALGLVLGVAVLFKYTALLLLPGLVWWWVWGRGGAARGWKHGGTVVGVMLLTMSPILIWNASRGWPTVSHQLGRLHLPGGDEAVGFHWDWRDPLEFLGAQAGILGLTGVVLVWIAAKRAWAWRQQGDGRWAGGSLLLASALPILGFYGVLCVFKACQGNWAIAGYSGLMVLVGLVLPGEMDRWQGRRRSVCRASWRFLQGFAVVMMLALFCGPFVLRYVPGTETVVERTTGNRDRAVEIEALRQALREETGQEPFVICGHYMASSLLAFYLPDQPSTYTAMHAFGGRRSAYDFFEDTRLDDPALHGRPVVLIGAKPSRWEQTFELARVEARPDVAGVCVGYGYEGLREAIDE